MSIPATPEQHSDFPPRLLGWALWCFLAGLITLLCKNMGFWAPMRESWLRKLTQGTLSQATPPAIIPDIYVFLTMMLVIAMINAYIFRTHRIGSAVVLALSAFFVMLLATPSFGVWGIYFFSPALLSGQAITSLGALITSFLIKKHYDHFTITPSPSSPTSDEHTSELSA